MSGAVGEGRTRLEDRPLAEVLHHSTAKALSEHFSLETVGDLLDHLPRRYMPRGELTPFSELEVGQEVSIVSQVVSVSTRRMHTRRGSIAEVLVTDRLDGPEEPAPAAPAAHRLTDLAGAGTTAPLPGAAAETMTLSFFNAWTAAKDLRPGDHVMFSGTVGEYRGRLTLTNPHYAVLAEASAAPDGAPDGPSSADALPVDPGAPQPPIPVYPATAKYTTDRVAAAVGQLLDRVDLNELEDPVPEPLRARHRLMTAAQAYRAIHRPEDEDAPHRALRWFRYREALVLQTALARRRAAHDLLRTEAFPRVAGGRADAFDAALPFALTAGQRRVGEEIAEDLAGHVPMNRLLQGDVGSGKTLVALRAMLQVADAGAQAALLAPTEVLAAQHYRSVLAALGPLGTPAEELRPESERQDLLDLAGEGTGPADSATGVVLLTASMPAREKRRALLLIASGTARIVIGTHALLSESVAFADLGLVVVDEQHRFGVHQRHALARPDGEPVHRLVMTATPIPRSVAMTVFGDLRVSVLDELPAGRQEVATHVVSLSEHPAWERRLWQRAREEIDAGHQVFVVVPTIAEDGAAPGAGEDERGLRSVEGLSAELSANPDLRGIRLASVHGRMDGEEKSRVMDAMARGETDLLVATTVIEVGVDVPNATLMVVMDADRLGISTLHQLRGRIGRGGLPGTCLLVTGQDRDGASIERLQAVAATRDGFELSRTDLEQRREGDILGASQSGRRSTLRTLSVLQHGKIIEAARRDAEELVAADPSLEGAPALAAALRRAGEDEHTEYLYRG